MSGHSKWATIKHKKGAADKKRGKLFAKLIKQVEVAARQGGGDVAANATLRTMFQKAREASVPLETIERAVKRGTGELEGVDYQSITYEGYAPHGVAVLVECLTDNRNRTGGDVRSTFSKNGGSLAEPGAVSWQFARTGVVYAPKTVSWRWRSMPAPTTSSTRATTGEWSAPRPTCPRSVTRSTPPASRTTRPT
jgi:YebC/PmpR family DNA-binding regulatory protein